RREVGGEPEADRVDRRRLRRCGRVALADLADLARRRRARRLVCLSQRCSDEGKERKQRERSSKATCSPAHVKPPEDGLETSACCIFIAPVEGVSCVRGGRFTKVLRSAGSSARPGAPPPRTGSGRSGAGGTTAASRAAGAGAARRGRARARPAR